MLTQDTLRMCTGSLAVLVASMGQLGCDSEHPSLPTVGPCQAAHALHYLYDLVAESADLTPLGLSPELSTAISQRLLGADGLRGSGDDGYFRDFDDLRSLAGEREAELSPLVDVASRGFCPATDRVVFAPGPRAWSHVARLTEAIDTAERSIDISIYSFADDSIEEALRRAAVDRGVSVRVLYEGARDDAKSPSWSDTISGHLEALGAEVRWLNIINHHKFAIIDGPRTTLSEAAGATLISGSANWGERAAGRYDESTVFIQNNAAITLPFQQEFNRLWAGSRGRAEASPASTHITDADVGMAPVEVLFTSANFDIKESQNGPVLSARDGSKVVQDRLVEIIQSAERSVWVASAHLRLRRVAEALLERRVARPGIDARVYVDQQEYEDEGALAKESDAFDQCVADAAPYSPERAACYEKGLHFANILHQAGVPVRFKVYSSDWRIETSRQMHHKYIVVDGRTVAAGSYNLSDNAERSSLENMVIYTSDRFPDIVRAYEDNFAAIWRTGEDEERYARRMDLLDRASEPAPRDFAPMAIDWARFGALRSAP